MVGNNVNHAEVEICSWVKDEKLPAWSFEAVINEASKPNGYRIPWIPTLKLQQTFFCHSVAKKNSHFNELVFNVYTPLCMMLSYLRSAACLPAKWAICCSVNCTFNSMLFNIPKEVAILSGNQYCWDKSPADNGPRLLLVVRVSHGCRLRYEWISLIFVWAISTVREDSRRAKLSFLQTFASTLLHWIWVKLPVCTTWLDWWRSCWMKHTIRSLHHRMVCVELNRIFFREDEKWKIGKLNLILSSSIFFSTEMNSQLTF